MTGSARLARAINAVCSRMLNHDFCRRHQVTPGAGPSIVLGDWPRGAPCAAPIILSVQCPRRLRVKLRDGAPRAGESVQRPGADPIN